MTNLWRLAVTKPDTYLKDTRRFLFSVAQWCKTRQSLPFVELVDHLKVHVGCPQHLFINQVEGSVGNELAQVPINIKSGKK